MLEKARFCALASSWNQDRDRFMPDEGLRRFDTVELIQMAAQVKGLSGIELIHPTQVRVENLAEIKSALDENAIQAASIAASISSKPCFRAGSLIADDPEIRGEAIQTVQTAMDVAEELGTKRVNVWLGRDGFDYPFQIDYDVAWKRLVEAFQQIGRYQPEVRVAIGYKPREPRAWLLINTAAKTILLAEETGLPNIGAVFDNGHTIWSLENMAEVIALTARKDRLFHVHFNDNTRVFDDNMPVGSIHFFETLEMLYWLDRVDYDGWISFDPHLNIEDGNAVIRGCLNYTRGMLGVMEQVGKPAIEDAIASHLVTEIMELVGKQLFPTSEKFKNG